MKKVFFKIMSVMFLVLFLGSCALIQSSVVSEKTKVIGYLDLISVEVPESVPNFIPWQGNVLGGKTFPNGNGFLLIETWNADGNIYALTGNIVMEGKLHILFLQLTTFLPGWEKDDSKIKMEYFEDIGFLKTGKPSDKLTRVQELTDWKIWESKIGTILI